MRVLILTPTALPAISGNAVTVERWKRALEKRGILVSVLACEALEPSLLANHLRAFGPDLIHIHHAFKAGALLLKAISEIALVPPAMVASPGGTDINEDLEKTGRKEVVKKIFELARVIVAQSPFVLEHLQKQMPNVAPKLMHVPKAVCWLGNEPFELRNEANCNPNDILFLLPSGVRPVKGNLECLKNMKRVHDCRHNVRFVAAGPAINMEYAALFEEEIRLYSDFACWIKTIPLEAMRAAYEGADIVMNSSFSEGLSNALMEAIGANRPVLASDIPGNRWPVLGTNGDLPVGLLYDLNFSESFVEKALALIDDAALRAAFRNEAKVRQSLWPQEEDEAKGLIEAYNSALVQSR